jgi:RNA polymerase sigma-70 factor (ECF subfamily)
LAQLCQLYWRPLYAYARKRGFSKPDAEDLTQGFFQQVLSRDSLGQVGRRETSKLRSFLLTSLRHYITSDWRKMTAQKRGGDAVLVELEEWDDAEAHFEVEGRSSDDPERFFDRRWAAQTLENHMKRL